MDWTDPYFFKNPTSIKADEFNPPIAPVIESVSYYSFREKIFYKIKLFNEKYYVMPIKTNAPVEKITYQAKYFISSLSDEIEASLYFLYLLHYDKELYTLFRYGIEGTDYVNTPSGLELQNLYSYSQMSLKFENPFIEPKLAHDFSLWSEFMDEYLLAQVKDSGITDRYRNEQIMRETINSLRENDSAFDEIIKNRINIYGKFYSGDVNAINNFLHTKTLRTENIS
jgi:hypothetical protein